MPNPAAEPNPWDLAPVITRDSEEQWLPHYQRFNGALEPLVNSAGGLFPKPRVKPIAIGVYNFSFFKQGYSDAQWKEELNTLNSGGWGPWAEGDAWITRILWQDVNENGKDCAYLQYTVKCNEFGWDRDFLQMGYYYLDGADKVHFRTEDGVPYIGLLDAAGAEGGPVVADDQCKRLISFPGIGLVI